MNKLITILLLLVVSLTAYAQLSYNTLSVKNLNLPSETASKALFLDASKNIDSGTLPRAFGGTGLTAAGAVGNVLTSDGTDWVSSPAAATGITGINGENGPSITLANGTAGTDFAISAAADTITFNIPSSSAANRGLLLAADWTTFNNKVSGPVSSTDNAVVRWDLATGKITQDSVVLISDTGAITGVTELDVDNVEINGNQIASTDANGDLVFAPNGTGDVDITKDLRVRNNPRFDIHSDAASGANATLSAPTTKFKRLTGALTSVDMIPAGGEGQELIIENDVGSSVSINNETGGTATNRIKTGTGASITLLNDASLLLSYDTTEARWMVVGGSGSAPGTVSSSSGSSTDNHIATFDGVTGTVIQDNSTAVLSDAGALSGLTQLDVDNLRLDANTISSTNINGSILFDPNGTGNVNLPDLTASLPLQLDASKNIISSLISLTAGVTGVLPLANGGTNKNITASNGAVFYSDADSFEVLAPGTSGQVLQTNGAGAAPSWVTPTSGETVSAQSANFTAAFNTIYLTLNSINVQLPAPVANGKITIKKRDSSVVTILRAAAESIDGTAGNITLAGDSESVTLVTDGTNWFTI